MIWPSSSASLLSLHDHPAQQRYILNPFPAPFPAWWEELVVHGRRTTKYSRVIHSMRSTWFGVVFELKKRAKQSRMACFQLPWAQSPGIPWGAAPMRWKFHLILVSARQPRPKVETSISKARNLELSKPSKSPRVLMLRPDYSSRKLMENSPGPVTKTSQGRLCGSLPPRRH